jgi:uncharacterized protein YjbK
MGEREQDLAETLKAIQIVKEQFFDTIKMYMELEGQDRKNAGVGTDDQLLEGLRLTTKLAKDKIERLCKTHERKFP